MTSILVTGGAGFIGSHISESLIKDGHSVTAVDNLTPYYSLDIKKRNVEICRNASSATDGSYDFVEGDIRHESLIDDLKCEGFDYVFHEAAQAGVRKSVEDPLTPNEVNVEGTLKMLQLARALDVERFVNASSSSVYGKAEYLPFDEEHPTTPVSPYGVSKLAAEHYCRVYNEVYDVPTVSLRYFTVYGPRMRPGMAISNFAVRCLNGKPPEIYGDGSKNRDFTYIEDVVDANKKLLDTDAADGEMLNIGSGGNITVQELAEYIIEITGSDAEPVYTDPIKGDAEATHSDYTKANDLIGYSSSTPIREGVEKFVRWLKGNRELYEDTSLR